MKRFTTPLSWMTLCLGLSACQINPADIGLGFGLGGGSGGGVHFGTGINIPIGAFGVGNNPARSGININQEQIVTYFTGPEQHYQASPTPQKGGFYRQLLGKQGALWLVQDFYYDTGRKYNEPMLLGQNESYQFDSLPASGTFYTYHDNGQLASKRVYQQQRLTSSEQWTFNGQTIR